MSIFVKIRNILIILKVFYWLAFKATIKALYRKNLSLYLLYYLEHINIGHNMPPSILKLRYSKVRIHSQCDKKEKR